MSFIVKEDRDKDFLEEVFSSRGRVRILRVLLKLGEANITKIVKETGLHHYIVEYHLNKLINLGIIVEKRYGRSRVFAMNHNDPRVKMLKEVFNRFDKL